MNDFNKELRERWKQKKKKAGNWTSLMVKVFILLAILYFVGKFTTSKNIDWSKIKNKPDTMQVAPAN